MIVGLGMDVVELERIHRSLTRFGESFAGKILHPSELGCLPLPRDWSLPLMMARLAARFAAKEAGAKALGTGFSGGIGFHDIRVHSLGSGKPEISFHGQARARAEAMAVRRAHLSLTHSRKTAAAVVLLEAGDFPEHAGDSNRP